MSCTGRCVAAELSMDSPISFNCDRLRVLACLDPSLVAKMTVLGGVSWGQAAKLNC